MGVWDACLLLWTWALAMTSALPMEEYGKKPLLMPHNRPQTVRMIKSSGSRQRALAGLGHIGTNGVPDTYSCFPMRVPENELYITGFEPHATQEVAHHVLIYGCEEPGQEEGIWDCGEMNGGNVKPVCARGSQIIYAWAKNAEPLQLPEGVGFKVGRSTKVKWLVLQVHYMNVSSFLPPNNGVDDSGVVLQTTSMPLPRRAGTYLMLTGGELAPHSKVYLEAACSYDEPIVMHPFAFRVHTHEHGKVVAGYTYRDGKFTEIGRRDPQLPQMFYPVENKDITVQPEDLLFARCTMVNDEDRAVKIGMTHNDEMCNFYMMYYVDGSQLPNSTTCFNDGNFHWSQTSETNSPPDAASTIPGTNEIIPESHTEVKVEESYSSSGKLNEDEMEAVLEEYLREVEEMEEEQQEYEKFLERAFQEQKEEDYEPEEPEQELFQRIMRAEDEYPYDSQDLEMLREYYENL